MIKTSSGAERFVRQSLISNSKILFLIDTGCGEHTAIIFAVISYLSTVEPAHRFSDALGECDLHRGRGILETVEDGLFLFPGEGVQNKFGPVRRDIFVPYAETEPGAVHCTQRFEDRGHPLVTPGRSAPPEADFAGRQGEVIVADQQVFGQEGPLVPQSCQRHTASVHVEDGFYQEELLTPLTALGAKTGA